MARVNHKKVKQLIQQKRGKITDQEFFISRLLSHHFEDMAAAQTKRYDASRRVRVRLLWQPGNPELAYTDNLYITINAGNPAITDFPTRGERYQIRYLAIAAEHGYLNYLRKLRASARTVHLDSLPENFQRTGWEEDPLTQVARREELAEAYAKLPETYREVLALLVVYGLSPQEAAVRLGCTVEQVYQRKSRALKRLREMMGGRK